VAYGKRRLTHSVPLAILCTFGNIVRSPIVIAWILSIGGLVTLTAMSVPKLRAMRISAADVTVKFQDPPIWLDDSLLLELQDIVRIQLATTPIGREGLIEAAHALRATGWFSEITQVQWVSSFQADVEANFLIPYAKVHDEDGVVFIDTQARKLPSRIGAIVKPMYHFITLIEPNYPRPQRPGLQWNGEDVMAGLKLLKMIYGSPWATQVQSINLTNWSSDQTMIIVTDMPSQLYWGSAPGEEHGLEALAHEKIERLNWVFTKFGRIDKGTTSDFDLTDTTHIIRN